MIKILRVITIQVSGHHVLNTAVGGPLNFSVLLLKPSEP